MYIVLREHVNKEQTYFSYKKTNFLNICELNSILPQLICNATNIICWPNFIYDKGCLCVPYHSIDLFVCSYNNNQIIWLLFPSVFIPGKPESSLLFQNCLDIYFCSVNDYFVSVYSILGYSSEQNKISVLIYLKF